MDQNALERITVLPSVDIVMHLVITLASTVKYPELDTQLPVLTCLLTTRNSLVLQNYNTPEHKTKQLVTNFGNRAR